ncbi:PREDICTED: uncharacterized protein LOC108777670 [Cyphomyrmex costatus]|uniref:Uncharacterized protein n=1 Tax=Cyphomyrmex costatus TaxID=456900 RepID=A0A151ID28_9HYME|nr:PREDICTED: uncharacterized protein LOC108777670 [Cyphomyrmex costatus]KYM98315.1 hypothetical protein ALC62_11018 [Cyphomyrmex costatus]
MESAIGNLEESVQKADGKLDMIAWQIDEFEKAFEEPEDEVHKGVIYQNGLQLGGGKTIKILHDHGRIAAKYNHLMMNKNSYLEMKDKFGRVVQMVKHDEPYLEIKDESGRVLKIIQFEKSPCFVKIQGFFSHKLRSIIRKQRRCYRKKMFLMWKENMHLPELFDLQPYEVDTKPED